MRNPSPELSMSLLMTFIDTGRTSCCRPRNRPRFTQCIRSARGISPVRGMSRIADLRSCSMVKRCFAWVPKMDDVVRIVADPVGIVTIQYGKGKRHYRGFHHREYPQNFLFPRSAQFARRNEDCKSKGNVASHHVLRLLPLNVQS